MSAHVNSRADVCHSAPQSEDSVLSCHVLPTAGVAHSWPMLHACLSETLCDFARYGPVPRVLRFTCFVRGGHCAICLLRWECGYQSVPCVTGDGRD